MTLRRIPLKGIDNFRDVGGYPARYGETSYGVLYRSSDISHIDEADLPLVASLGIKTIIDLRSSEVQGKYPDHVSAFPGATYYHLEANGGGRIPVDEEDMYASYFEMIEEPLSASKIFRTILNCEKPMVIHCTAGKDRTGLFVSLVLLANGVDPIDVNADYLLSLPLLKHTRDRTLKAHPDFPHACLYPSTEYFPAFLERFEKRYGSLNDYFISIGLTDVEIKGLSNLLGVQERSYGAVLLYDGKALLEKMGLGHISLPKGHAEPFDRDINATIHREIAEEIGLKADEYDFVSDQRFPIVYSPANGHIKRVEFKAAVLKEDPQLRVDHNEVTGTLLVGREEAEELLTFQSDRDALAWAYRLTEGQES